MREFEDMVILQDHKDADYFKELKAKCWEAASKDKEISFAELPCAQYKYFSELYWLYNDLAHDKISKEEAEKRDRANYAEFCEHVDEADYFVHSRIIYHDNIKRAGTLLSEIEKTKNVTDIAIKACEALGCMTGDENFIKRIKAKLEAKK